MRFVTVLSLLLATQAHAQSINDRVVELVTDYGVALNDHYSTPFAFVAAGTQLLLDEKCGAIERNPSWWIHAKKGKKHYSADGYQLTNKGRLTESWKQRLFDGTSVKYSSGRRTADKKEIEDEEEVGRHNRPVPTWPLELTLGSPGRLDYHVTDRDYSVT